MYKDKDKQREANRARQQRRRDVIKSKGVTNTGRDGQGVTVCGKDIKTIFNNGEISSSSEPRDAEDVIGVKCLERVCQQAAVCTGVVRGLLSTGAVTGLPGDADYNGVCTPEWREEAGNGQAQDTAN